jgi:glycosyltransferase involved in cell wall biosynthesis
MKKLAIDINSITAYLNSGSLSGIARTTFELISALSRIQEEFPFEITLFSQNLKGISGRNMDNKFKSVHLYLPYRNWVNRWIEVLPIKETLVSCDLIHIPHNFEYLYRPQKSIVTLHDVLFMHMNESAFDHLEMRKNVPRLIKKCKGVITCSHATKNDISETIGIDSGKIDVIYWGLNREIFFPMKQKDVLTKMISETYNIPNPYFLSVSCNTERKNTHLLLEAYFTLLNQNPANDLVLVWNNPPDFIYNKIEKSRYKSRIHILNRITDDSLAYLYNGATALIFPSSYEGFGLPVIESMACGTPVVTCNNSSLKEIGGHVALYMEEPTVENILFYLESFENRNIDSNSISAEGIKYSKRFNWDQTAKDYIKAYSRHLELS